MRNAQNLVLGGSIVLFLIYLSLPMGQVEVYYHHKSASVIKITVDQQAELKSNHEYQTPVRKAEKENHANQNGFQISEQKTTSSFGIRNTYTKTYHKRELSPQLEKVHQDYTRLRVFQKTVRPNLCTNCNNFNFNSVIKSESLCSGKGPIDLLVLVTTIPKEVIDRDALRKTWIQHTKGNTANVRHAFLFGGGWSEKEQAILNHESAKYGDILQEDYKDTYYNLSSKVMSGYKWALRSCNQAKFILRTANDNYINIPEVLKWIKIHGPNNMRAQIGHSISGQAVLRRKTKRTENWVITYAEFPERLYPPFAVGTAFLYSMVAVEEIVKIAPNIPYFCLEDAWFGMLMREIKMPVMDEQGFDKNLERNRLKQLLEGECPEGGQFLSIHLVSPEGMGKLWKQCPSSRLDVPS